LIRINDVRNPSYQNGLNIRKISIKLIIKNISKDLLNGSLFKQYIILTMVLLFHSGNTIRIKKVSWINISERKNFFKNV